MSRWQDRLRRTQRGSVSVLTLFIVLICGSFGAFVSDAGTALKCATEATNYAAEAGRAANEALGPLPSGGTADYGPAIRGATNYLAQVPDVVSKDVRVIGPGLLSVTVTVARTTPLLHIAVRKSHTETVRLEVGTNTGENVP